MSFASGSVSFRRFVVVGKAPKTVDQKILDKLDELALRPGELGMPDEVEYGWCGGRHVLDASFSFEHNVFADALHFALRIDTNKVPSELKKAWQLMEEEAAAANNPSGFISKGQKKDVRDSVRKQMDKELRAGRFRKSKLLPILWDLPNQMLYCSAHGSSAEKLIELFERTFGLELQPLSSGALGLRALEDRGKRRDYEDFRPTRFVQGPDGEGQWPEYGWTAKGPQPKDFLGNEFLLWLWHEADARSSTIKTEAGDVTIYLDKSLNLECAFGQTGKDTLSGDGPSRMIEARDALRTGKVPRKAGLVLDANRQQFSLNFNAEALAISGAKLPDVEEADSPRVLFEERVQILRDLCKLIDGMFDAFLKLRASSAWEGQTSTIKKWIMNSAKAAAA